MMMSGSWRISARRPSAKPMSSAACTWVWLKAGSIISIGSSIVQTLTSSVARLFSVEYSVVVLPLPVGPVTRMMPCGRAISCCQARRRAPPKPSASSALDRGLGVEDAHHHLLAEGGGQGRQAHLDLAAGAFDAFGPLGLDAAVQRPALLDHVHAAEQLDARRHRAHHRQRHLVDGVQHAVDAKADRAHVAPRLEVDVAGTLVEGVLPQPVDDLHHALVVGVELLVASCPARPAARSWHWRRLSPRLLRRAHRLGQGEELGRVAAQVHRVGHHQPDGLRRCGPRSRRPRRCRRARRWRSTTSVGVTVTGSTRRSSA